MADIRRSPGGAGQALRRAVSALDDAEGRVGWFESAKYEDGTPVALAAVVNEYGAPKKNIPARSFMRSTQTQSADEWRHDARLAAAAVAAGKMPPGALMQALTMKAEGAIRRRIADITEPELAEATIEARRRRNAKHEASVKPLVDTGLMLNSLSSQVTKK